MYSVIFFTLIDSTLLSSIYFSLLIVISLDNILFEISKKTGPFLPLMAKLYAFVSSVGRSFPSSTRFAYLVIWDIIGTKSIS